MKINKGEKVPIKQDAEYTGQDVDWTEPKTDEFVTKEEMVVYHNSGFLDREIKEFLAKKTCFHAKKVKSEAHHYALIVPAGTRVEEYDDEVGGTEYRINITSDMDLYYLGFMERNGQERFEKYTGIYRYKTNYNDQTIDIKEVSC